MGSGWLNELGRWIT